MIEEPNREPIRNDDNEPASKREFRGLKTEVTELKTETNQKFDAVLTLIRDQGKDLRQAIKQQEQDLRKYIKQQSKETRHHFDVVAENIHKDVAAANKDEINLIKDQQLPDHEDRLQDLEKHTKLPVGPRHATPV